MIRRLVRAAVRWFRRNRQPRVTRAQRIARVALAADIRWDSGFAAQHLAEWENELLWGADHE